MRDLAYCRKLNPNLSSPGRQRSPPSRTTSSTPSPAMQQVLLPVSCTASFEKLLFFVSMWSRDQNLVKWSHDPHEINDQTNGQTREHFMRNVGFCLQSNAAALAQLVFTRAV